MPHADKRAEPCKKSKLAAEGRHGPQIQSTSTRQAPPLPFPPPRTTRQRSSYLPPHSVNAKETMLFQGGWARRPALILGLAAAALLFAATVEASTGDRLVIFRDCVKA